MGRRIALGLALAAVLLLLSSRTFLYYRDNFSTHYPVKSVTADVLRAGELPLWNFFAGGGQPLAGNPNTLTFYPDTLLYLVLPAHTAFNVHFWIHLAAGFFAMRALLAALGGTKEGSLVGASLYLASGVVVSSLAFYNLVTAIALVPLALVAVERLVAAPSVRRAITLGAVFGLLALAGEPVIVVAVAAASIVVSFARLTRRVVALASVAIAIAAIVASPLFLAYGEIAGETERGMRAYSTETVLSASLSPARLLEMVVGPFRGLTTDYGPSGYSASVPAARWPPLFMTVFLGAILIPALFAAALRRYVVVFGLLAFFALGADNAVVVAMLERFESLRIVRYPEKLAIPMTAAAVVLIALWLDRELGHRRARGASIAAIALLAFPLVAPGWVVAGSAGRMRVVAGCLLAIATLVAALAARRSTKAKRIALLLTFLALGFWWVRALPIDSLDPYRLPSPLAQAAATKRVFSASPVPTTEPNARLQYRIAAAAIEPLFGAAHGVRYALEGSPEGMYSFLSRIVQERMQFGAGSAKIRYLQLTGCDTLIAARPIARRELTLERTVETGRSRAHLYRVPGAMPRAWTVARAIPATSIQDAVRTIESAAFDPRAMAIVPPRGDFPTGEARVLAIVASPQSLAIEIEAAAPATLIVNESYFSAWHATIGGDALRTFPANIDRLGIVVPPGRATVRVAFGKRRPLIFAAWAVSLAALAAAAFRGRG